MSLGRLGMFTCPRLAWCSVAVFLLLPIGQIARAQTPEPESSLRRFVLIGGSVGLQTSGDPESVEPLAPLIGVEASWHVVGGWDQLLSGGGLAGSLRYDHGARGVELAASVQGSLMHMLAEVGPVAVLGARRAGVGVRAGVCITFAFASACGHWVYGTHGQFFQLAVLGKGVFEPRPFRRFRVRR